MGKSNSTIELKQVSKKFKNSDVINRMNLKVHAGEFLVLLGPSGCGKSTTLRMIAGLEDVTEGSVLIDGHDLQTMKNDGKAIAMVFQDYALYPNMTVYQNLEYALKVHKVDKQVRKQRIDQVMDTLNLADYADRLPSQLSGGQKQRVAVGRGMVKKSKIFLLDEPLSNIDVQLREKARDELQKLHEIDQQTIVYVTHDQLEAMALGDRIAVMNEGIIQMIDTPDNIYNQPANLFVARFIGTPQINIIEVVLQNGEMYLNDHPLLKVMGHGELAQQKYYLGIRPENIKCSMTPKGDYSLPAKIDSIVDYGRFIQLSLKLANGCLIKSIVNSCDFTEDDQIYIDFVESDTVLFDHSTEKNLYWGKHE
ncbi:ABC transporter ATP-binding protein [Companilactobacillus furfuricola]|uniref:ABC transporter ATP-binding protein n=1 Tax=Companilactobacillus furfuricola TaxID=1462575 RepID=UPI000F7B6859|nr:ABC transporter ATP-binding protein [Companilactobacillus furfuricola]